MAIDVDSVLKALGRIKSGLVKAGRLGLRPFESVIDDALFWQSLLLFGYGLLLTAWVHLHVESFRSYEYISATGSAIPSGVHVLSWISFGRLQEGREKAKEAMKAAQRRTNPVFVLSVGSLLLAVFSSTLLPCIQILAVIDYLILREYPLLEFYVCSMGYAMAIMLASKRGSQLWFDFISKKKANGYLQWMPLIPAIILSAGSWLVFGALAMQLFLGYLEDQNLGFTLLDSPEHTEAKWLVILKRCAIKVEQWTPRTSNFSFFPPASLIQRFREFRAVGPLFCAVAVLSLGISTAKYLEVIPSLLVFLFVAWFEHESWKHFSEVDHRRPLMKEVVFVFNRPDLADSVILSRLLNGKDDTPKDSRRPTSCPFPSTEPPPGLADNQPEVEPKEADSENSDSVSRDVTREKSSGVEPYRIVFFGETNSGKTSLMRYLLYQNMAGKESVGPQVHRNTVTQQDENEYEWIGHEIDGRPLVLRDTPGLYEVKHADNLEDRNQRAQFAIQKLEWKADLAVVVIRPKTISAFPSATDKDLVKDVIAKRLGSDWAKQVLLLFNFSTGELLRFDKKLWQQDLEVNVPKLLSGVDGGESFNAVERSFAVFMNGYYDPEVQRNAKVKGILWEELESAKKEACNLEKTLFELARRHIGEAERWKKLRLRTKDPRYLVKAAKANLLLVANAPRKAYYRLLLRTFPNAIFEACYSQNLKRAMGILRACANMSNILDYLQLPHTKDYYGSRSVLHLAVGNGWLEFCKQVVDDFGANVNIQNEFGGTALHLASWAGRSELCKWLVDNKGMDVNAQDNAGRTALHLAALAGRSELCKWLVDNKGMDVNVQNEIGETVLHFAASGVHSKLCTWLVDKKGMDVNVRDNRSRTALHLAALAGRSELCKWLVDNKGMDVNLRDNNCRTVLHLAAWAGCSELCEWLIDTKGMDVNVQDKRSRTALHLAASAGQSELCKWLVDSKGMNVKVQDDIGRTALHFAASAGHSELCKWLVDTKGMNWKARDNNGETAADIASWLFGLFD